MENTPLETAQQWAQQNPQADQLVRVITDRTDKRSAKSWADSYYHVANGAAVLLTKRQVLAHPYLWMTVEKIDLRTPQTPKPFHEQFFEALARTRLTAACPVCGAVGLEVRRDGNGRTLVNHCGSLQPVYVRGTAVVVEFMGTRPDGTRPVEAHK